MQKENMKIEVKANGIWYHGAKVLFSEPRTNSTITQWKELAETFSHQPSALGYNDDGVISHNGVKKWAIASVNPKTDLILNIGSNASS